MTEAARGRDTMIAPVGRPGSRSSADHCARPEEEAAGNSRDRELGTPYRTASCSGF
jgi:hypothetical protein